MIDRNAKIYLIKMRSLPDNFVSTVFNSSLWYFESRQRSTSANVYRQRRFTRQRILPVLLRFGHRRPQQIIFNVGRHRRLILLCSMFILTFLFISIFEKIFRRLEISNWSQQRNVDVDLLANSRVTSRHRWAGSWIFVSRRTHGLSPKRTPSLDRASSVDIHLKRPS